MDTLDKVLALFVVLCLVSGVALLLKKDLPGAVRNITSGSDYTLSEWFLYGRLPERSSKNDSTIMVVVDPAVIEEIRNRRAE